MVVPNVYKFTDNRHIVLMERHNVVMKWGKDTKGPTSRFSRIFLIPPHDNNFILVINRRLRITEVIFHFALGLEIIVGTTSATSSYCMNMSNSHC